MDTLGNFGGFLPTFHFFPVLGGFFGLFWVGFPGNGPGMGVWNCRWCQGGEKKSRRKALGKANFRIICTGVAAGTTRIPDGNVPEDEGATGSHLEGNPGALPVGFWGILVGIFPQRVSEWKRKETATKRVRLC